MSKVVKIITQPKYLVITATVTLAIITFAAWLPNLHLIAKTISSPSTTLWQKINLLTSLLGSLRTNFTTWSRTVTVVSAMLTGIQVSLLIYYLRLSVKARQEMGMSFAGVITSLLGIGCASCGSIVLTSLIGLSSAATVLGIFPFKGLEFGLAGIAILLLAIHFTVKKIDNPLLCKAKERN